jgi:hypothetical protein
MSTVAGPYVVTNVQDEQSTDLPFKICNMCLTAWPDVQSFMKDRSLVVNGYQAFFSNPDDGLILFTHKVPGCGSTLALKASVFKGLYRGPQYQEHLEGTHDCGGHCLHFRDLEVCTARCDMRWVRDILQQLRHARIE